MESRKKRENKPNKAKSDVLVYCATADSWAIRKASLRIWLGQMVEEWDYQHSRSGR
jgi:hypothetical protein